MKSNTIYTGIDGCKGGWIIATFDGEKLLVIYAATLELAIKHLANSSLICIDMPMGLPETIENNRKCDTLLRKELGYPFNSSVFNVPCRQAVYAKSYTEANAINKQILLKGLSKQSWNICSKIRELDQFLIHHPEFCSIMKESHPELCFKNINQGALSDKKRKPEGFEERLKLLNKQIENASHLFLKARSEIKRTLAADDDILDAIVLHLNAQKILQAKFIQFPAEITKDSKGISMVVYSGNFN